MQHQPRQEDHIPPAPPERGLTLSRPPLPSVIRRPAIRPAPFEPPSRPTSRPQLIEGTLDLQRDALSPPTEQLISTGLAKLASMTRQSQNSTHPLALITLHLPRMQVDPRITAQIMAAYERQAKVRYKALMNKLLSKGERPIYVTEEAWRRYVEYWESDDFKARSKIASSNRAERRRRHRRSKKLGRDCTSLELYLHVHTKKHDGQTFIDAQLERVNRERRGDDPHVDETDLYYKVIGVDHKGRVYGLRSTGRRYNDPGASSSQSRSSQDFATLQSNVSRLTSIVEDQQNQIQMQHEQIALLQSILMQSMRGGHPGASSRHPPPPPPPPHPRLRPPPPPRPSPALDANDVYRSRMYEPEDEEETDLPLQQEWIDALSDTHPLPQPDRDN
ncbi:hypothetical protein Sjap_022032 [Stephania japonica]|uniref:Uncharacterized protein n=1 Tax=Stephania japonica TaxID=461633 RepID=A0AAP0EN49_9MAGN